MRTVRALFRLLMCGMVAVAAPNAFATLIKLDFEEIAVPQDGPAIGISSSYSRGGARLTVASSDAGRETQLLAYGPLSLPYTGSISLAGNVALDIIALSLTDGGVFALNSIDFWEIPNFFTDGRPIPLGPSSILVTGVKSDSTQVTKKFPLSGFPIATQATFSDFQNIVSVSWKTDNSACNPDCYGAHLFDNVVLSVADTPPPTTVPEPSTIVLMVVGLAALGFYQRSNLKELFSK